MLDPYKKKVVHRLNKARGQLDGILKMIEKDKSAGSVLTQVLALYGSLKSLSLLLLESSLRERDNETVIGKNRWKREKVIKEIIKTCELSSR